MNMKFTLVFLFVLPFVLLTGCNTVEDPAVQRGLDADKSDRDNGDIHFGVTFSFSSSGILFRQGIEMAQDEVNKGGGIRLGDSNHQLVLFFKDDKRSINDGRRVALEFIEGRVTAEESGNNTSVQDSVNIVAVIGNLSSFISIPVSTLYNYYGVLMLSPGATSPKFTAQGYNLVFRNIVQDREIGKQMADFAKKQGCLKVMVASSRSSYGRGLGNEFEKRAQRIDLEVVDRRSFEPIGEKMNFSKELDFWKHRDFDAVFLAGAHPEVTILVQQMRKAGLNQPVFGGDGIDVSRFCSIGGKDVVGSVAPAPFHYQLGLDPDGPEKTRTFVREFVKRYKMNPDTWAAQGYDAVKVLVAAMEEAGSSNPGKVAEVLHSFEWIGVTGKQTFDGNGDVDKELIKKIARFDTVSQEVRYEVFADNDSWLDSRKGIILEKKPAAVRRSGY